MKNLLFITWDGPQTSYMEGLFMPIFNEISKKIDIEFHVIQFTWADKKRTEEIRKTAENLGIKYTAFPIFKKPVASLGSFFTLFTSSKKIEKYIKENNIDVVMPRSNFPAFMVNQIKNKNFKILFDADGLVIEERVDFAGLKRNSFLYKFLKTTETKMLKKADAVITRSQKAIDIHLQNIGKLFKDKFFVVINGRNSKNFVFSEEMRKKTRNQLNVADDTILLLYVGSLGTKYALQEMYSIYKEVSKKRKTIFLILTGDKEYVTRNIPKEELQNIIVKRVASQEVSHYISAADIGFALIYPTYSMQGAVPTKLGEYLLCGIPVIASKGIGDTEDILKNFEECYLFDHSEKLDFQIPKIIDFAEKTIFADKNKISEKAKQYFSLEAAAESYLNAFRKL